MRGNNKTDGLKLWKEMGEHTSLVVLISGFLSFNLSILVRVSPKIWV